MTYNNCVKQILDELHALPPAWAEKLACNICGLMNTEDECNPAEPDCTDIRDCQTVTSLSTFDVDGNTICISFRDEHGVVVKRCFEFSALNDAINDTDGTCLNPLWGTLSATEKWQSIIDKICLCCNPTTTTTTTSTTTTTTIAPCTDCVTMTMFNPTGSSHSFTYKDCSNVSHTQAVTAGNMFRFCGCPGNVTYNHAQFVLTIIADTCISVPSCETCNQYVLSNLGADPQEIVYTDCDTLLPASVWVVPGVDVTITCACTDSVLIPDRSPVVILNVTDCPSATTSTTTTTTAPPCRCYSVQNLGGIDRVLQYTDCDGNIHMENVPAGNGVLRCAQTGLISGFGLSITDIAACADIDACNNDLLTTTTTSTTTTTTIAPTTTTTTTTTSTTTTTTLAIESDIVYFTNTPTNGDRGAKILFSTHDYYTPNTPASLIAANCLNTSNLGISPNISVTVRFWKDDMTATIDDGFGAVRTHDGTKTVNIPSDLLTYNVSSGAWQVALNIFTLAEGANIAAFKITAVTTPIIYGGVQHNISLPPANHYIRVHNTFSAGATGVIWFDLT